MNLNNNLKMQVSSIRNKQQNFLLNMRTLEKNKIFLFNRVMLTLTPEFEITDSLFYESFDKFKEILNSIQTKNSSNTDWISISTFMIDFVKVVNSNNDINYVQEFTNQLNFDHIFVDLLEKYSSHILLWHVIFFIAQLSYCFKFQLTQNSYEILFEFFVFEVKNKNNIVHFLNFLINCFFSSNLSFKGFLGSQKLSIFNFIFDNFSVPENEVVLNYSLILLEHLLSQIYILKPGPISNSATILELELIFKKMINFYCQNIEIKLSFTIICHILNFGYLSDPFIFLDNLFLESVDKNIDLETLDIESSNNQLNLMLFFASFAKREILEPFIFIFGSKIIKIAKNNLIKNSESTNLTILNILTKLIDKDLKFFNQNIELSNVTNYVFQKLRLSNSNQLKKSCLENILSYCYWISKFNSPIHKNPLNYIWLLLDDFSSFDFDCLLILLEILNFLIEFQSSYIQESLIVTHLAKEVKFHYFLVFLTQHKCSEIRENCEILMKEHFNEFID